MTELLQMYVAPYILMDSLIIQLKPDPQETNQILC